MGKNRKAVNKQEELLKGVLMVRKSERVVSSLALEVLFSSEVAISPYHLYLKSAEILA